MKKILFIVFTMLVLFVNASCSISESIKIGDEIMKEKYDEVIVDLNTLTVIKQDEKFFVLIHDGEKVLKKVEFDSDRNVLKSERVDLKKSIEANKYLNKPFEQLVEYFGEEHTDIGSGFYMPSYITTDGYLLVFFVESGNINNISKLDLLSNNWLKN